MLLSFDITRRKTVAVLLSTKYLLYFTQHLEAQRSKKNLCGVAAKTFSVEDQEDSSRSRQHVKSTNKTSGPEKEKEKEIFSPSREQQQTCNVKKTNNESIENIKVNDYQIHCTIPTVCVFITEVC